MTSLFLKKLLKEKHVDEKLHHNIHMWLTRGEDLHYDSFANLFEHYMIMMPYGTASSRNGDPEKWIFEQLMWEWDHFWIPQPKCECGSEKANTDGHSYWCPKYKKFG